MRKLASIKQVSELIPIEGKDRIVLAMIDGWSVIVKKDEFKVGDNCVYVEIDSVLPEKPEFEFLRKNNFRIKTMKMAGCISSGICFPLSILPPKKQGDYKLDEDVTEVLGIKQYEKTMDKEPVEVLDNQKKKRYPEFLMRMAWFRKLFLPKKQYKGFPTFISKTDETRIQNIPQVLNDKREWVATEKIDGSSASYALVRHKSKFPFIKDKYEYMVCSRNLRLWAKDNSVYWRVSDKYQIEKFLKDSIGNREWIALQGECIAPNIQKNKYKVSDVDFYAFNLIYPQGRLDSLTAKEICNEGGIKFVPIVSTDYVLPDTVNEVLEYAHGQSQIGETLREGIVFRSHDGKQSFKAVDPLFLLKYDE